MIAVTDTQPSTGGKGQPSSANTGAADPNQLAEDFSELARSLEEHDDPDVLLAEIVAAAVAMVPGADEGSISVVTGRSAVGSQAPTGDLPVQVDALQEETGQGPCLDDESEQVGLLFASHAAVAYASVRKEAQLANAVASRDLIGQAKGILMERYKISPERAFLVLTRVSQSNNRKLHDIAAELARHGTVPGIPAPPAPS